MRFKKINIRNIKTYSVKKRRSKVNMAGLSGVHRAGASFGAFLENLPDALGARDLKKVCASVIKAHREKKTIAIGIGAHVVKVGLCTVIIDLVERRIANAVAMNGACVVHDFEIAYAGETSEDVDASIQNGSFGMANETAVLINGAIKKWGDKGLGHAVGRLIHERGFPNRDKSILAACYRLRIPATVHVALGTDIIHMHPSMDGGKTGQASMEDFRSFASVVASMDRGVYLNIGSAVVLPEVFLKALTLARNLGHRVGNLTTVNMDFIQQYRAATNVVKRPTLGGGRGFSLTGHHEIMVPILHAAIVEGLDITK